MNDITPYLWLFGVLLGMLIGFRALLWEAEQRQRRFDAGFKAGFLDGRKSERQQTQTQKEWKHPAFRPDPHLRTWDFSRRPESQEESREVVL
jgi:hypothetical protein